MRLHIPMHCALLVGIIKGLRERLKQADRIAQIECALLADHQIERLPSDKLHRNIAQIIVLANIIHGDNRRMAQISHEDRLTLKATHKFGVGTELWRKDLERNGTPQARIIGPIDGGHAAPSELILNDIPPELTTGHQANHGLLLRMDWATHKYDTITYFGTEHRLGKPDLSWDERQFAYPILRGIMSHHLSIITYAQDGLQVFEHEDVAAVLAHADAARRCWITLTGYENEQTVRAILDHFGLPPMLFERIVNAEHTDEVEEYENSIFFTYRYAYFKGPPNSRYLREADFIGINGAFICGEAFLIVFADHAVPIFERTRTRLLNGQGEIRKYGTDFLLYVLLRREFVDYYNTILKRMYQALEILEDDILESPGEDEDYRKLLYMRSVIKPFNGYIMDLIQNVELFHDEKLSFIKASTMKRFDKSLYREAKELWITYQELRHFITELVEIHRANVSENMNRVMQLLTGVSVVFLPLTFIAGVYGMNFVNMPELEWEWGYYGIMLLMVSIATFLIVYMRRRDWIPD